MIGNIAGVFSCNNHILNSCTELAEAVENVCQMYGSMSIVGVRFFESRSFFAFEVILMFCSNSSVLLHGKQTFKCQSIN